MNTSLIPTHLSRERERVCVKEEAGLHATSGLQNGVSFERERERTNLPKV